MLARLSFTVLAAAVAITGVIWLGSGQSTAVADDEVATVREDEDGVVLTSASDDDDDDSKSRSRNSHSLDRSRSRDRSRDATTADRSRSGDCDRWHPVVRAGRRRVLPPACRSPDPCRA